MYGKLDVGVKTIGIAVAEDPPLGPFVGVVMARLVGTGVAPLRAGVAVAFPGPGVLVFVAVGCGTGVLVFVAIGCGTGVFVRVAVGALVGVRVAVAWGTGVFVRVAVACGIGVFVFVAVGITLGLGVFVSVGVTLGPTGVQVGIGVGSPIICPALALCWLPQPSGRKPPINAKQTIPITNERCIG